MSGSLTQNLVHAAWAGQFSSISNYAFALQSASKQCCIQGLVLDKMVSNLDHFTADA